MNPVDVRLSVVVPAYNEEARIARTVERIAAYLSLKGEPWEILVSDDGSTDGTSVRVREAAARLGGERVRLLRSDANRGKGDAVRRGALAARGERVLVTDADLSAPIKESDKLLRAIDEGADAAIGSRALREPGCDVQESARRWIAGRVFNLLVKLLVVRGYHDTQCGFKCFTREAARKLFALQKIDGFSFDVELLYLAKRQGLKVREVPVMWSQGPDSRVRLLRDSIRMFRQLFLIRRLHRR